MSDQQPPEQRASAPAGAPPGWYPDPGGLQALRWWDGAQWSPYSQPLSGAAQEPQLPYPSVAGSASSGYGTFRQERAGGHRQQGGPQDDMAYTPDLASRRPSSASFPPGQPQQSDPYRPQGWPQQQAYAPGSQPRGHRASRRPEIRKARSALIGLGTLIGIIAVISVAAAHRSSSSGNTATTSAAATAFPSSSPSAVASAAAKTYPDQAADTALCKTYTTDISNGDTCDIQVALEQAAGSVSPKLARDIQATGNGTTLQQDMQNQLNAAMDCALVQAGVSPGG